MYNADVNLLIDNDLLEGKEVEGVLISPLSPKRGIIILSENMYSNSQNVVIRIYRLKQNEDKSYSIHHEMEAFSFVSCDEANDFVFKLPQMSAIDMLSLLKPTTVLDSNVNNTSLQYFD